MRRVHEDGVARADDLAHEGPGQLADALLVGPTDDQRPRPLAEELLDRDDLAGQLALPGEDDVERLVEDDLLAPLERLVLEIGVQRHPHLAARRVHVDGAVVVVGEVGAVGRRRAGQLVDLVAQRGDVLARLAQRVGQLLVLVDGLGQLALGLEQALLEGSHALRRVLQAAPERERSPPPGPAAARCSSSARLVDGDHLLTLLGRDTTQPLSQHASHLVHAGLAGFTATGANVLRARGKEHHQRWQTPP